MSLLDSARQERAQEESAYQQRLKQADKRNETLAEEVKTLEKSIHQYQLEAHAEQQAYQQLQTMLEALEQRYQEAVKKLEDAESALAEEARLHDAREKAWQEQLWSRMDAMQRQLADLPGSMSKGQEGQRKDEDCRD
ncbi:MAG: hypothetical protein LC677_03760 [Halomonas sp.]|nr:hypothetical protein [Halomonas sp.]